MNRGFWRTFALCVCCALLWSGSHAAAQGVTTASITGVVLDEQKQSIPGVTITAVHVPSGTTYVGVTQGDGRFLIQGLRVGGPYKVTAALKGFTEEAKTELMLSLGVTQDLQFGLKVATVSETVTVVAVSDTVFSSTRTGAATSLSRDDLALLPTISGRLSDITRLTPQASGSNFAGADSRMNNVTVDGAYFNNSFGLRNAPGDTSGVAPISLEAVEQVQVNVAPYDVRQANFVGAGINTVTRSGTNKLTGSIYTRYRNESFVGTEAKGLAFNPGKFKTKTTGGWAGGPIVKNKLFAFGSYEKQEDTRPISTFRANKGGEPVGGSISRVTATDLNTLSAFLSSKFQYETGPYENISKLTPGKPMLLKGDYNLNDHNKVTFRYTRLDSSSDTQLSQSSSLGFGRNSSSTANTNFLSFQRSNYSILENIRSGIGEWNSVIGAKLSNTLIIGYTTQDESRGDVGKLFPFVDILDGSGVAYTSFGTEPFSPDNQLRYKTFQLQDNFTKFANRHSLTFGTSIEKYHSDNVFYSGKQSVYVYSTLNDFYIDANDYLANPNRTTSPITLRRFQVNYLNIPTLKEPVAPLDVWYSGGYVQDEWRPRTNLTVMAGLRADVARFGATGYSNAQIDALTFRDEAGNAVKYSTAKLPDASPLWSPRIGFNWDVSGDARTQLRGGTGVFTGKPPYVWISNQISQTGVLLGSIQDDNVTFRPFNPNPDRYKPTSVTGAPAASVNLAVTQGNFRFPQVWRTNVGADRRLPWGFIGTGEFIYNRDVNGAAYFNANLPVAPLTFSGVDNRMRWPTTPSCSTNPPVSPCATRLNNAPGNQIINAIVLKNQNVGRSWNIAATLSKSLSAGMSFRSAYSYGEARNPVDPGSVAAGSWTSNAISNDPNNPKLAFSGASPGHRFYISALYTRRYLNIGATTVALFWEARTIGNTSYVFAGDMNGDSATGNDLIYIPRDTSEMNFAQFTASGRTFTSAEQATAFEAFISQDKYLSQHRGEYAQRGAVFLPLVKRMDLGITQDVFHSIRGRRHSGQIRLDVTNFGNLLNHSWGVSQRVIQNQILTNAAADAQGRVTYRLALFNNELVTKTFQSTSNSSDVYVMMLSFRYTFQ